MVSSQRGGDRNATLGSGLVLFTRTIGNVADTLEGSDVIETEIIRVRYWAAAKSAAGVATDALPVSGPLSLADVVRRAVALHPGTRLGEVLAACSCLIGERPAGTADPELVSVPVGSVVEFLPPFAGG